jgi:hypothetical protein
MSTLVRFHQTPAPGWDQAAACRLYPTETFYDQTTEQEAVSICRICPVAAACLNEERQVFLSTGSEVEDVLGVRGGLTAGQRRLELSPLKKHAEHHVLQDATLTVADRAVKLGVSKRTLQRRLAATRCAA